MNLAWMEWYFFNFNWANGNFAILQLSMAIQKISRRLNRVDSSLSWKNKFFQLYIRIRNTNIFIYCKTKFSRLSGDPTNEKHLTTTEQLMSDPLQHLQDI